MGTCLSKKRESSNDIAVVTPGTAPDLKCISNGGAAVKTTGLLRPKTQNELKPGKKEKVAGKELKEENPIVIKKEIFVIRHRKSHDKSSDQQKQHNAPAEGECRRVDSGVALPVISSEVSKIRSSSCTKEEVDAILIQCGRLSRSSSASKAGKYSGSKRSFDFDNSDRDALAMIDDNRINTDLARNDDDGDVPERRLRHRQRNRQSPRPSPSRERRRTHSRERDPSGQRERRVSRSPGRRSSETSGNSTVDNTIPGINNHDPSQKPAKMVSVPATVSSLAMEKSNIDGGDSISATAIKRISVKRNAGNPAVRVVSSPRAQSPVRIVKVSDENMQQNQPSLSRSSSRKAEISPYRRNALNEIDPNSIPDFQAQNRVSGKNKKETESDALNQKPKAEAGMNSKVVMEGSTKAVNANTKTMAEPKTIGEETTKIQPWMPEPAEPVKPQTLTRTRSARRSRDLDINPETLLNSTTSYTALLLEDIHNFHQKSTTPVSLPPCLTKACSILEAVADLNSTTSSNLSCTFSGDRTSPVPCKSSWNDYSTSFGADLIGIGKRMTLSREPFVESEVVVENDVMEPSFHKYVTVDRSEGDAEDQESFSSSSWEPISKSVDTKEDGRQRNGRTRKENVRVKERLVSINLQ